MKLRNLIIGLMAISMMNGCTTINPYTGETEVSKTSMGTGIGAATGALAGQLIGGNTAGTLVGAAIGAGIGGVAGNYMDQQNAELRQRLRNTGVQVIRTGKDIRLVMSSDITFANNRADIKSNFYSVLNSVATVLNKFNNTTVKVVGYTSSVGSKMYNQQLSEKRARSIADYFIAHKVDPNRLMVVGYGARYPIASNATEDGRAQNRRVEITIHPLAR